MDDARQTPETDDEAVLFDAVLTPHRSLSPRGFVILMLAICFVSFSAGLGFYLAGAWPVIGFLGLDVLLIYLAFKINYRHGRAYETLHLTRERLLIHRVDHWGSVSEWHFQPSWLQVLMDDPPRRDSQLVVRSHGKSLAIGKFLTLDERLDLAKALRDALRKVRRAPDLA
ncbi:MAG: DUF2244 domain-containing protein [Pseudomonadota bacterium]